MSYRESVRRSIELALKETPTLLDDFLEVRDRLSVGYYGWWQDVIVQQSYRGYDIYDAAVFCEIQAALHREQIAHSRLVGIPQPAGDKATKKNRAALANLIAPFRARFTGSTKGDDGWLAWSRPIELDLLRDGKRVAPHREPQSKPGTGIPLEVGYTDSATTLWRLAQHRALARWPYSHEFIFMFVVVDNYLWRPRLS